jgi:hypothetical protein
MIYLPEDFILFYGWIKFQWIYIPHFLNPFICCGASWLLWIMLQKTWVCMSLNCDLTYIPSPICLALVLWTHMTVLFLVFWGPSICFWYWLYEFTFPPTLHEGLFFLTSSPTFIVVCVFDVNPSNRGEVES